MNLKVLATGSSGNCYLLRAEKGTLILDAGIPFLDIKRGLDYDIRNVSGLIVSHVHNDHSKSMSEFQYLCPIFAPYRNDTKIAKTKIGEFDVSCFDLPHNGTWNNGFLVKSDGQKVLYMTDFEYCKYNFRKQEVNHIIIECNYQNSMISKELANYEHKVLGHCSLDTCLGFIEANATNKLRTVTIIHMGGGTCNPQECVEEIRKIVDGSVNVDYARPGLEVEMNSTPF